MDLRLAAVPAAVACVVAGLTAFALYDPETHRDPRIVAESEADQARKLKLAAPAVQRVLCTGAPAVADVDVLPAPEGEGFDGTEVPLPTEFVESRTPEEAVAASERMPPGPYRKTSLGEGRWLFAYVVDGVGKAALVVERRDDGSWGWTRSASCNPAEFAPTADDAVGVRIWTDAKGRRVPTDVVRGGLPEVASVDCFGEGVSHVWLGERAYVRDPKDTFRGELNGLYEKVPALPDDAVDTGFRRAGVAMWRAKDHSALYFVDARTVQRVPAEKGFYSCM